MERRGFIEVKEIPRGKRHQFFTHHFPNDPFPTAQQVRVTVVSRVSVTLSLILIILSLSLPGPVACVDNPCLSISDTPYAKVQLLACSSSPPKY